MTTINKSLITAYSMTSIYSNGVFEFMRNTKNLFEIMNDDEKELSNRIIARAEQERKEKRELSDKRIDELIQWYIEMYESEHDTRKFTLKAIHLWTDRDCEVYDIFTYDENWEFVAYYDRADLQKWQEIEHYLSQCEFYLNRRYKEEA